MVPHCLGAGLGNGKRNPPVRAFDRVAAVAGSCVFGVLARVLVDPRWRRSRSMRWVNVDPVIRVLLEQFDLPVTQLICILAVIFSRNREKRLLVGKRIGPAHGSLKPWRYILIAARPC